MENNTASNFWLQATWQLFLVFLIAKFAGWITWSWYILTLPLTVPIVVTVFMLIYYWFKARSIKRKIEKAQKSE